MSVSHKVSLATIGVCVFCAVYFGSRTFLFWRRKTMKICSNCGTKNFETNEVCEKCGQPLRLITTVQPNLGHLHVAGQPQYGNANATQVNGGNGLRTAIKVFLILDTVRCALAALVFGVLWITFLNLAQYYATARADAFAFAICMIVCVVQLTICGCMMITYFNKISSHRAKIGVGFKICVLLFASFIGGLLMLCDETL